MKIINIDYESYAERRDAIAINLPADNYDQLTEKLNELRTKVVIEILFMNGYKIVRACKRFDSNDIYAAIINENGYSTSYIVAQFNIMCDKVLTDGGKKMSCYVAVYEEYEAERFTPAPYYVYDVTDELDGPEGMDNPGYARNRWRNHDWAMKWDDMEKVEPIDTIDVYHIIKDMRGDL